MTQATNSCWNFYTGWEEYQGHLVRAVAPLSDEQLRLGIAPHLRSIGQIARHNRACARNLVAQGDGGGQARDCSDRAVATRG
jgi:hypothetical protein